MNRRLILITGAPRSGTTAIGSMLALAPGAATLHEPFNLLVGLREIDRYFQVPGAGQCSSPWLAERVACMRALRLRFKPGLFPKEHGWRRFAKRIVGGRAVNSYRLCRATPGLHTIVWKDPFACFAAAELCTRFGMAVAFAVRTPWAVAASFKRMHWAFDLDDLFDRLRQAGLYDAPFDASVWGRRDESVVNGLLLWIAIHTVLRDWLRAGLPIATIDLDTVVARPVAAYQRLYRHFGLSWSDRVERRIQRAYASGDAPALPASDQAHDRHRDLGNVNTYWKSLLGDDEVALVASLAGELWQDVSQHARRAHDA